MYKTFGKKRYKYFSSENSKNMAMKRAEMLRKRDKLNARVSKDERKYASTWHIYVRKR